MGYRLAFYLIPLLITIPRFFLVVLPIAQMMPGESAVSGFGIVLFSMFDAPVSIVLAFLAHLFWQKGFNNYPRRKAILVAGLLVLLWLPLALASVFLLFGIVEAVQHPETFFTWAFIGNLLSGLFCAALVLVLLKYLFKHPKPLLIGIVTILILVCLSLATGLVSVKRAAAHRHSHISRS